MNGIHYEPYDQRYLKDIVDCWNQTLIYDGINEQRFIDLVVLDDNFDPNLALVALDGNQAIGFVLAIRRKVPYLSRGLEPNRGFISLMFVHPNYQNQGIGNELLLKTEAQMIAAGVKEITLCAYSPNYFTPGIDKRYQNAIEFFEQHGYALQSEAVSMQRHLFDYSMSQSTKTKLEKLKQQGIQIIAYQSKYMSKLNQFLMEEFDAGWVRNARIAMQQHIAEETILLCIDENDEIIGYCMRKIDGNDARFGPIGVANKIRSMGLGGLLFEVMMQDMKERGIYYLYFLWTHGDAQRFYEKHGMSVYREYQLYRKVVA